PINAVSRTSGAVSVGGDGAVSASAADVCCRLGRAASAIVARSSADKPSALESAPTVCGYGERRTCFDQGAPNLRVSRRNAFFSRFNKPPLVVVGLMNLVWM